MGKIVIESPLEVDRHFRKTDAQIAAAVLRQLESLTEARAKLPGVGDEEVLSAWQGRAESPDEIARQLRQMNRQHD